MAKQYSTAIVAILIIAISFFLLSWVCSPSIEPLNKVSAQEVDASYQELPKVPKYFKELTCTATAYTASEDECGRPSSDPNYGRTASGEFVRRGIIAVDPAVIPLHSTVWIEGTGEWDGKYVAKDTGGAIIGNRVDIYVPTKSEAWAFGRRVIKVYVIEEG